jgi:hypothetical protein
VTQTYLSSKATTSPYIPREASAAGRLRSNALSVEVPIWRPDSSRHGRYLPGCRQMGSNSANRVSNYFRIARDQNPNSLARRECYRLDYDGLMYTRESQNLTRVACLEKI